MPLWVLAGIDFASNLTAGDALDQGDGREGQYAGLELLAVARLDLALCTHVCLVVPLQTRLLAVLLGQRLR